MTWGFSNKYGDSLTAFNSAFRDVVEMMIMEQPWAEWAISQGIEFTVGRSYKDQMLYEQVIPVFAFVAERDLSFWIMKWGDPRLNHMSILN